MARKRFRKSFTAPGWGKPQAEALDALLAPKAGEDGPMGHCEMAGFLFALACAPDLVMPSEWIPEVLGENKAAFGFFARRRFAEGCIEEWEKPLPLEAAAARVLEVFPDAMRELAALGRGLAQAARA
jgi:Uncharacterised protein family (UPF0149)